MKKTIELPLEGTYGFSNQQAYRYTFTNEDDTRLERYKEEIIKALKYDFFYSILHNYKIGDKLLDWLIPEKVDPIKLDNGKYACIFNESIQGGKGGEVIVVYDISKDDKAIDITIYDRNATIQHKISTMNETPSSEYVLVDSIIESNVKIVNGKKLTVGNIEVYMDEKLYGDTEHSYESAMKVIELVKSKFKREEFVQKSTVVRK